MDLSEIFSGAITPAKWRALGEYLRTSGVSVGPGLLSRKIGNKTIIRARRRGGKSGAAGFSCTNFLLTKSGPDKFTVTESTVNELTPSGFVDGLKEFTVSASGVVFATLVIDSSGSPVSCSIDQAETVPEDTDTDLHRLIGNFAVTGEGEDAVLSVSQVRCGPLQAAICRNWFAAEAPLYGVTWL